MAKIKMKYKDFEFEIEGGEAFVESKINDFPGLLDRVIANNTSTYIVDATNEIPQLTQGVVETHKSINEFINEKKFGKDVDLILGLAYYLVCYNKKEVFTSQDIKECLKKAKIPSNKNIADLLNNNIRKGFIEEASNKIDGRKTMIILQLGLDYINNYTPKSEGGKINRKSPSSSKIRLSVTEQEIIFSITNLDRYDADDINKIRGLKNQKMIILSCIYLLNKVDNQSKFSVNILYEFIRKISLNIDRKVISARISDTRSYYDKTEDNLLQLSNYGKSEIEKLLNECY